MKDKQQLQLAQLAGLGMQASILVHELRQPLFALKAYLELHQAQSSEKDGFYQMAADQIDRMESLLTSYGALGVDVGGTITSDFNETIVSATEWMRMRAEDYGVTL